MAPTAPLLVALVCLMVSGAHGKPSTVASPPPPPPAPTCPPCTKPSDTQCQKGLFPNSPLDEALLRPICGGKSTNPNFFPCGPTGACSFCNQTCTPKEPGSCYYGGNNCQQDYGCGKAVIIKYAQGNINSCNNGPGFGSAKGNTNSNGNSQSIYYCAKTASTAAECCAECAKYQDRAPGAQFPDFRCKSWVLIAPKDPSENPQCGTNKGAGRGWVNQAGCSPTILTPYYGGCGWCFLLPKEECSPTCSAWGLTDSVDDDPQDKQNIYWALYGRSGCTFGKNDPHFTGALGTNFEFNGLPEQSFCLVSDKNLHINMKMHGYFDERTVGASILKDGKAVRTWMRELGIVWNAADETGAMKKHTLHLAARSGPQQERGAGFLAKAEYDGEQIPALEEGGSFSTPSGLTVRFTGTAKAGPYDVDMYHVSIEGLLELDLKLRAAHPLLQTEHDAEVHFNVLVDSLQQTPAIHGVLGQTYRAGRTIRALEYRVLSSMIGHPVSADGENGLGFLDGSTQDYVASSVLSTDCKFAAFET